MLVTGGAGFIGSHLVRELVRKNYYVRVLDNLSTGRLKNLDDVTDKIDFVEGDIRSYHVVQAAVKDIDVIFHQAALPSVPRSVKDPITSNDANVTGTLNVLSVAVHSGVKRVIFASSSSVYGNSPQLPKHEMMASNPLSPYAVSKLAGEQYCQVFARIYGLHTISLRYFNVFGPHQDPASQYSAVIPKFITAILNGRKPIIYGDGHQSRDFTFVENVVHANLLAATVDCEKGLVVNCACNNQVTLNELVSKVNELLRTRIEPTYGESRPGDVQHSFASIEKAKKNLGFMPIVEFDDGLRRTVEWYANGKFRTERCK